MFGTVSEIASDINIGKFIDRFSPERIVKRKHHHHLIFHYKDQRGGKKKI